MRIYLAGPMRGFKKFNRPAFVRATELLHAKGHEVFSPSEQDRLRGHAPLGDEFKQALKEQIVWITDNADAMVVLPGWEDSEGCQVEVKLAILLGVPVWGLVGFLTNGPHEVT